MLWESAIYVFFLDMVKFGERVVEKWRKIADVNKTQEVRQVVLNLLHRFYHLIIVGYVWQILGVFFAPPSPTVSSPEKSHPE